jgi:hypothetical protein
MAEAFAEYHPMTLKSVTLELTAEEASTLKATLAVICGDAGNDSIYRIYRTLHRVDNLPQAAVTISGWLDVSDRT